ncbi:NAD dependent epimerase/ dehydratase [Podospora australis]|uniref:NAD dependent epimerase/ dehydratase n=1 Tax=Podospora australis TaxID=1536484 RepID=A0AAN6WKY3_9PEZI|nr:NAD dependent epimerase/ dehydratase [Podospora australis]
MDGASGEFLITGANGYIGNAVARAFVRAGWTTYGLLRSSSSTTALALKEIIPIIGSIDDPITLSKDSLPPILDVIVSTTEVTTNYEPHFNNIVTLLRSLSQANISAGSPKPLVIFTSGCKDYGADPTHLCSQPGQPQHPKPHTEETPLNPPSIVAARAFTALKILEHTDVFRPVLVRPTNVYGRSSSFYAGFFVATSEALASSGTQEIVVPASPNMMLCALHIDDCGDAYVAIASHASLSEVEGQVFNISPHRYETAQEIEEALVREYKGLTVKYDESDNSSVWLSMLAAFPQWTDSSKLRRLTGWEDKRPLFSEALGVYRRSFEAAEALGDPMIERLKGLMKLFGEMQPPGANPAAFFGT